MGVFGCDEVDVPTTDPQQTVRFVGMRVGMLLVHRGRGYLVDTDTGSRRYDDCWWVSELRFGVTQTFVELATALRFADAVMLRLGELVERGEESELSERMALLADFVETAAEVKRDVFEALPGSSER